MGIFRKKKLKNERPTNEVCVSDSVQNAASTLLANIRFSAVDAPLKSIVVTSSIPNEGKTTVALSLAIAAGRSGSKVVLLEGDMRRRSLRAVIGAKPRHGLHALITGKCTLDETATPTDYEGVWFIDAEAGIPNPDGLLNSRLFSDLLDKLHDAYDFVIIDTPPITAFPDASIAASKADATILVAREDYTDKREISFALQQLRAADANVLGVSLNCLTSSSTGSYGYYYGYYYDEKTVPADSKEAKEALERVEQGDTSISVKSVLEVVDDSKAESIEGDEAAVDESVQELETAQAEVPKKPATPTSGPTAAAPGSSKRR